MLKLNLFFLSNDYISPCIKLILLNITFPFTFPKKQPGKIRYYVFLSSISYFFDFQFDYSGKRLNRYNEDDFF